MAMGLLGALLPDMSCSVRMCGECRGCGAEAEPPVGPMVAGGEGGTRPATVCTVCTQMRTGHSCRKWVGLGTRAHTHGLREEYLFGGIGGGQVFLHLLLHGLTDVVVGRILKVGLNLTGKDRMLEGSYCST